MSNLQNRDEFLDLFQKEILKKKGHRWATLSTFGTDYPHSRNIILRKFVREENKLIFFTHQLSQKVEDIKSNAGCSLCWYDEKKRVQIIIHANAIIENNSEIIKNSWQTVSPYNHKDYLGPKPGLEFKDFSDDENHFCIIYLNIEEYVFLQLDREEHFKLSFNTKTEKEVRLVP